MKTRPFRKPEDPGTPRQQYDRETWMLGLAHTDPVRRGVPMEQAIRYYGRPACDETTAALVVAGWLRHAPDAGTIYPYRLTEVGKRELAGRAAEYRANKPRPAGPRRR